MIRYLLLAATGIGLSLGSQSLPLGSIPIVSISCTGSDSFTGTGTLSACWTQAASPAILSRVSGSIQLTSGAGGIAVYSGKIVSSTFTITTQSSSFGGPCILMQTNGTGYCWFIQGAELFALLNGGGVSSFGGSCPGSVEWGCGDDQ